MRQAPAGHRGQWKRPGHLPLKPGIEVAEIDSLFGPDPAAHVGGCHGRHQRATLLRQTVACGSG